MKLEDTLTIIVAVISALISMITWFAVGRNSIYDRIERSLLAIDDKFIQYPLCRPYFYDKKSLEMEGEDRERCLALAEFILDIFSSVLAQRERFPSLVEHSDLEQFMRDMFQSSPVLTSHFKNNYKTDKESYRKLELYVEGNTGTV